MPAICIVNLEDVRTFARSQGERLPTEAHQEWLERAIFRYVISNSEDLQPSAPSRMELAFSHVARAAAAAETTVPFLPSARLANNAALVVDWLAGLSERDPRLAGQLRRVTFEDALAMSQRWHRQLPMTGREQALHGLKVTCHASMTAHGNFVIAESLAGA